MSTDIDNRFAVVQAALTDELDRQTARLKELTEMNADTGDPGESHTQDALLAATRRSVEQVSGALRRIADGAYGQCEGCAGAIPAERLEVLPHARFCVPCQQKQVG
ncbi:TraR/DksA family transcriptional regulator [Actinoplanes sp. NPDC026670]|uniref:TraR/DksA family transcriptional regulator n=1 Tax=Actinoplanes sp. NPDC026670 TaxID=3154700 RepID=UPI0033E5570D